MFSFSQNIINRAIFLGFCCLILSLAMIKAPFSTRGEAREALVAQSIIKQDNWILPRRSGDQIPSKPIFTHWLMALSSKITGQVDHISTRMPAALFSCLTVILLFLFASKYVNVDQAFSAALILLTTIEWQRASVSTRVDLVLSSLIFIALLSLFKWEEKRLKGVSFMFIAVIALACATLTKGPVAIVLPAGIFALYLLIQDYKIKSIIIALFKTFTPALMIASIWYIAAYQQGGLEFWNKVNAENFKRFTGSMIDDPHRHSAFYLYATLILGCMPWSLLLFFNLNRLKIEKFKINKLVFSNLIAKFKSLNKLSKYSWIIIFSFIIFYSIPASKRSVYLLPIYPFIALLASEYIYKNKNLKYLFSFLGFLCLTLLCLAIFDFNFGNAEFKFYLNCIKQGFYLYWPVLFVPLFLVLISKIYNLLLIKQNFWTLQILSLYLIIELVCLYPISKQLSALDFATKLKARLAQELPIYAYKRDLFALSFYLDRDISNFSTEFNPPYFIVGEKQNLESFLVSLSLNSQLIDESQGLEKPNKPIALYLVN